MLITRMQANRVGMFGFGKSRSLNITHVVSRSYNSATLSPVFVQIIHRRFLCNDLLRSGSAILCKRFQCIQHSMARSDIHTSTTNAGKLSQRNEEIANVGLKVGPIYHIEPENIPNVISKNVRVLVRVFSHCKNVQEVFDLFTLPNTNGSTANAQVSLENLMLLDNLRTNVLVWDSLISNMIFHELYRISSENLELTPVLNLLSMLASLEVMNCNDENMSSKIVREFERRIQQREIKISELCDEIKVFCSTERLASKVKTLYTKLCSLQAECNAEDEHAVTQVLSKTVPPIRLILDKFDCVFGNLLLEITTQDVTAICQLYASNFNSKSAKAILNKLRDKIYNLPDKDCLLQLLRLCTYLETNDQLPNALADAVNTLLCEHTYTFGRSVCLESLNYMRERRHVLNKVMEFITKDYMHNFDEYSDNDMRTLARGVGFFQYFSKEYWNFLYILDREVNSRIHTMNPTITLDILAHCAFMGVLTDAHRHIILGPYYLSRILDVGDESISDRLQNLRYIMYGTHASITIEPRMNRILGVLRVLCDAKYFKYSETYFQMKSLRKSPKSERILIEEKMENLLGKDYYTLFPDQENRHGYVLDVGIVVLNRKAVYLDRNRITQAVGTTRNGQNTLVMNYEDRAGKMTTRNICFDHRIGLVIACPSELNRVNGQPLGSLVLAKRCLEERFENVEVVTSTNLEIVLNKYIDLDTVSQSEQT